MSHSASEIDSGAISRRVNCTRLVVARRARGKAAHLSIKWQCTPMRERCGGSYVHGKTFRSAPWDNLRRSLPSASPVGSLSSTYPLFLCVRYTPAYRCDYTHRAQFLHAYTHRNTHISKHFFRALLDAVMSLSLIRVKYSLLFTLSDVKTRDKNVSSL